MTTRQQKRTVERFRRRSIKQWNRLDPSRRTMIVAGAVVQVTLFAAAQIDITKRNLDEIRGPKLLWRLVCLVNFIGPILYFVVGRVAPADPEREAPELKPIVA